MTKAFLSHSSKDKEFYVKNVAKWLGKDNVVYDEFTFEEGEKTLDEILKGLDKTDIFVLFISENSLESKWVQEEIVLAKSRLDENQIRKIYPIIIQEGITFKDSRIPEWIKESYNVKPITRAQVAAKRIRNKLRELSWSRHASIKKRQNFFVGRNEKQEEFEARIHDFDKEKPIAIVVSGIAGVGRRAFLHRALCKTNISEFSHKPSAIVLDRDVSIEDFILKLNDLGLLDLSDDVLNLSSKTISDKIEIIHKIMQASNEFGELIYLVDEGCIVNYKREVSQWFIDAVDSYSRPGFPIFCIASKYKVIFKSRPKNDKYLFIELNELNVDERKRLLNQLLELYGIVLSRKDFDDISALLFGLPEQVMYAVDLIREDNISTFADKMPILREYNSDRAAILLRKYDADEDALQFIRLLAQFEVISLDFIFSIAPEEKFYPILEDMASEHIVELIGIDGEIARLNDIVRDYIKRNRIELSYEYSSKINIRVEEITQSDDVFERDSSEYIFSLKESLKRGVKIKDELLIPSHYLRCMKDLYYNKGDLDRIVELADIILQKKSSLDSGVLQDIYYYLCLALAKKKDPRMLREVQNINGKEHDFLLGFYYRLLGRFQEALDRFNKIENELYVGARAKREIVQVYVQLEEYDKALDYARRNYEENKGNQFHTHAYFNCLINSENPEKNREKLNGLIGNLRSINSNQSNEMADISDALFSAKVDNNMYSAFDKADDCVSRYPGNHYPLLAFCDIALKYRDKQKLSIGIEKLEEMGGSKNLSSRTLNRYRSCLLSMNGKVDEALKMIEKDLSRYPVESRERIINKIKEYSL